MFTPRTFADVLQDERTRRGLREANDCHTPAGSPAGGQFCLKSGSLRSANPKPRRTTATGYLNDLFDYGGVMRPLGDIIKDLQSRGVNQGLIDRYIQGLEAGRRARKR